jgi:hypothetical protein
MRDRIDFGEGSSMTGSQSTSTLSQLDPTSNVIFEEEDLVLPFETPWNGRDLNSLFDICATIAFSG